MTLRSIPLFSLGLVLAALPANAFAQAVVQALPGTTDADRLAEQIRRLASAPQDVNALVSAGELSIKLDDLTAAASFFARAEKVDPRNARVKAGEGSILVHSERPGEALRYFAQAESLGLSPAAFAGDRGLAYDLIGEQERAQRDYRLAIRTAPDDETIRRYALSLGISGRKDQALAELDPLLRKTDRAAWRSRAFVLAMGGDQSGADHIAVTMMPPGMAQGLRPFFQRLPTLGPVDRAFAVHFGETRPAAERVADARMAPQMAALAPEPGVRTVAPVQVSAQTVQPAIDPRARKRDRKSRAQPVPAVQVASAAPAMPEAQPPGYVAPVPVVLDALPKPVRATASSSSRSATAAANAASLASVGQPRVLVAAQPTAVTAPPYALAATSTPTVPVIVASRPVVPSPTGPVAAPVVASTIPPERNVQMPDAVAAATPTTIVPTRVAIAPTTASVIRPVPTVAATVPSTVPTPVPLATTAAATAPSPSPAPGFSAAAGVAPPPKVAPASHVVAVARAATKARSEDDILARIIAGLSIPAAELDAAPPARQPTPAAVPVPDDTARVLAAEKERADRQAAAEQVAADKRAADRQAVADKKAADRKAAADKKALAAKKAAAEEKAEAARVAAEEKKAARANPERIWVQVAGGAYEGDLPKAYAGVKAKAPEIFAGHSGWSTPLRATNRVLAGPFKTDDDARAFVNQLKKKGVSAFTFTSDAGQKVTRLPAK